MNLQFWTGVKSYFALDRRAKVAPLQEGEAYELVISCHNLHVRTLIEILRGKGFLCQQ